jgi:hypothetical protein
VFDPELAEDPVWRRLLIESLQRLTADGAAQAVRGLAAEPG